MGEGDKGIRTGLGIVAEGCFDCAGVLAGVLRGFQWSLLGRRREITSIWYCLHIFTVRCLSGEFVSLWLACLRLTSCCNE